MRKLNRGDRRIAIVAIIVIAVVTILVAIVGPRGQKNAVASGNKEVETTTEALTTQQPEPETEPAIDYASKIVHSDGNNFVSIHGYGDIHEGGVNVRTEPDLDSVSIRKINIGTELLVKRYYDVPGWYGFDVDEIDFGNKKDTDGIVWISSLYCSVKHYNVPEENDDVSYEKIVRYNTPVKVVVNQDVNVNSRPTAGTDYSYGMIKAGASFSASIVYRNKTWIYFGFKVEELKESGFVPTYGDLDADPDGFAWIAEKYLSLYAQ